jgi:uncharacterized phiE125 gp8 family phage protein
MIVSLVPSAELPVSIDELKMLLRLEHSLEDALLATLLRTATDAAEQYLGQVLLQRAFEQRWTRDGGAAVKLQRGPLVQVLSVMLNGTALAATDFTVTASAQGENNMQILPVDAGEVRVQFVAGMAADWNAIPEAVRFGILRHAAHLYAHRDSTTAGAMPSAVPALWQLYRKVRLS